MNTSGILPYLDTWRCRRADPAIPVPSTTTGAPGGAVPVNSGELTSFQSVLSSVLQPHRSRFINLLKNHMDLPQKMENNHGFTRKSGDVLKWGHPNLRFQ